MRQRRSKNAFRRCFCFLVSLIVDLMTDVNVLCERVRHKMHNHTIFLSNFHENIHIYAKKGVWNGLDENQLQHKIKGGPSKLLPNSFQIRNLEGDI